MKQAPFEQNVIAMVWDCDKTLISEKFFGTRRTPSGNAMPRRAYTSMLIRAT